MFKDKPTVAETQITSIPSKWKNANQLLTQLSNQLN